MTAPVPNARTPQAAAVQALTWMPGGPGVLQATTVSGAVWTLEYCEADSLLPDEEPGWFLYGPAPTYPVGALLGADLVQALAAAASTITPHAAESGGAA
jgi:hypothetical protein